MLSAVGAVAIAAFACGVPVTAHADTPASLAAYVRARAADADGRSAVATAAYAEALAQAPDNAVIAARSYREALAAGDMALALRSARALEAAGVASRDTAVLALADAVRRKDWGAARAATDRLASGPISFIGAAAVLWLDLEAGAGKAPLPPKERSALTRRFVAETQALVLVAAGKPGQGIEAAGPLLGEGSSSAFRRALAALVAGQGDAAGARRLLANDPSGLAALGDGAKGDAAFGVAQLLARIAADIADSDASPLAIVLARAALLMQPQADATRIVLAQALLKGDRSALAIAELGRISGDSPYAGAARSLEVSALARSGDEARAIEVARALAEAKGADAAAAQRLADLLEGAGRHLDAARAYALAIDRAGPRAGWALYLQRGAALDQAKRWPEARAMLRQALALAPDEPVVLNYLGYGSIERGENVAAARAMIERAARLRPEDSSIADSLGWAYFQGGDTAKALPLLERAARAQPAEVTIQEHLGDAYWKMGRRYEARYAWRAAAVAAQGEDAARLAGKIALGAR